MNTLDELVRVHNSNRKKGKTMAKMAYIVFDLEGIVYGVYEELTDAQDREAQLLDDGEVFGDFLIEEYVMNKDVND